jgi:hypothetical protein
MIYDMQKIDTEDRENGFDCLLHAKWNGPSIDVILSSKKASWGV